MENIMRDNLIRFKQRGFSGRKNDHSGSPRHYERDLRRLQA